jgi:hypothetical protein
MCGMCVRTVLTPLVVACICGMCVRTVVTPLVVACMCGMCVATVVTLLAALLGVFIGWRQYVP